MGIAGALPPRLSDVPTPPVGLFLFVGPQPRAPNGVRRLAGSTSTAILPWIAFPAFAAGPLPAARYAVSCPALGGGALFLCGPLITAQRKPSRCDQAFGPDAGVAHVFPGL